MTATILCGRVCVTATILCDSYNRVWDIGCERDGTVTIPVLSIGCECECWISSVSGGVGAGRV